MRKPVILLGAGASIDAGLSDTNTLTRRVYDLLEGDHDKLPARIFGYVIAKILTRKARHGGSPFDAVNIEEAYDGVEKLVFKGDDLVSEFVSSWDPFLDELSPKFEPDVFIRNFTSSMQIETRRSLSGGASIGFDTFRMRDAVNEIAKLSSAPAVSTSTLQTLISTLISCLAHDEDKTAYMAPLIEFAQTAHCPIISLNYDLIVESILAARDVRVDYGLNEWNSRKIVTFTRENEKLDLLKLHGSLNWIGTDENIKIENSSSYKLPLLIFGNTNRKLRPEGPFLQLRHEFEKRLMITNRFLVVGYSFGDAHLNSIIRRWVATRTSAKLIIVDPGKVAWNNDVFQSSYSSEEGKLKKKTVDIVHIKRSAAEGLELALSELGEKIDQRIDTTKSGYLPDILVSMIE